MPGAEWGQFERQREVLAELRDMHRQLHHREPNVDEEAALSGIAALMVRLRTLKDELLDEGS